MSTEKSDYYKVFYPAFRFALDRKFDREVSGDENILDEPAIYTANHIQFADSLIVAAAYTEATDKPLRFAAKKEYFEGGGINDKGRLGRITKWFMEHTMMIPVDRKPSNPRSFMDFQASVSDRLNHGDSVALHPEGTRSQDGKLHKFKSGASRIAIAQSVPIVPVGLYYEKYHNANKTHVDIQFGPAITPDQYTADPYSKLSNREKAEYFIDLAEGRVAEMIGVDRSHEFAQIHKQTNRINDKQSRQ